MASVEEKWGSKESIDAATETIARLRQSGGVDRLGAATGLLLLATVVAQLDALTGSSARIETLLEQVVANPTGKGRPSD